MPTRAAINFPFPRIVADAFAPYTGFVLVMAMLFGGGTRQGLWSDVVVQLAALPLLACALFKHTALRKSVSQRWAIVLLSAIIVLPLCQLVPLPPAIWSSLPGRQLVVEGFQAAGITLPWLPISLDPAATWHGLLSLIPAVSIFLALLSLDSKARRNMVILVFAVVFVSVPLDMLQMMGGVESPLRFYEITNAGLAVGFFANANHHAAFLYCAIPFAAAWALAAMRQQEQRRLTLSGSALLVFAALLGISLTSSRAGMALALLAGVASLGLVILSMKGRSRRPILLGAAAANLIALLIVFYFGFASLAQKTQDESVMADLRWPVAKVTTQAAITNMPFGTGFGTFVPVYEMFAPRNYLKDRYINHAHDDWLELWLTGGVPALVLVFGFLLWFGAVTLSVWRNGPRMANVLDLVLARAASIVILLLLLHSIVDYPLRTIGLSVLFGISCALLTISRSPEHVSREEKSAT